MTPGMKFRKAIEEERPLQVIGTINAYVALMAESIGYRALYLSGAGVANSSYGWPDVGITTLDNVLEEARRITGVVEVPLLVDVDTGWGGPYMMVRTVKAMIRSGVAAIHIEDQAFEKRCGHLPGKHLVTKEAMTDRLKAAVDARTDASFVLMARTDAFAQEGLEGVIERGIAYQQAGADMLFAEAIDNLEHYRAIKKAVGLPLLANMTEFGVTPLKKKEELGEAGVDLVLYPLSVNRAMNFAGLDALKEIREQGNQKELIHRMQSRKELYEFLNYNPS
ncbi:MAG: methylisocitrate lyase [Parachlamydia sp.]|nr:methylisocitrate lyase [Parachlamydia sp.]